MKLDTSKGIFDVRWIGGPSTRFQTILIESDDSRPLAEIAADYDGLQQIEYSELYTGRKVALEGYSRLCQVSRMDADGPVQITLAKGV